MDKLSVYSVSLGGSRVRVDPAGANGTSAAKHVRTPKPVSRASKFGSSFRSSSAASDGSSHLNREQVEVLLDNASKNNRLKDMIKMISVIMFPILALICVTAVSLANTVQIYQQANEAKEAIQERINYAELVAYLQDERGLTTRFLSDGKLEFDLLDQLSQTRNKVSLYIGNIVKGEGWQPFRLSDGTLMATSNMLRQRLDRHRQLLNLQLHISIEDNIRFYTDLTTGLLYMMAGSVRLEGDMWKKYVSMTSLLTSLDALGQTRALGSGYYMQGCSLTDDRKIWFISVDSLAEELKQQCFRYYPEAEHYYEQLSKTNPGIERLLRETIVNITLLGASMECMQASYDTKTMMADHWFDNITVIMDRLRRTKEKVNADIELDLDDQAAAARNGLLSYGVIMLLITLVCTTLDDIKATKRMIESDLTSALEVVSDKAGSRLLAYSTVMACITIACSALGVWYAASISKMTRRMGKFANKMKEKSAELRAEKKRTDYLLYQMLPKVVADQLKAKQEVQAEYYDIVTIFFSDIVGFTQMSSKCSPHDIVILLNQLYTMFDDILEKYDVYKVETIGDAYMVVSGCPVKNGTNHVSEIGLMALEVRHALGNFVAPQFPFEKLKLRIGVHSGACKTAVEYYNNPLTLSSGSCVSGVVGTTRPRYCLFGDTVNTANRMETTSEPNKIHISQSTKDLMDACGIFVTEPRGDIEIKGKGMMASFWLVSCDKAKKGKATIFSTQVDERLTTD